jgi:pimeloyl-ACP methyl ester carboxylesterase
MQDDDDDDNFKTSFRKSDEPFIKELFPDSKLEFLDAGHWVHAEKSVDFLNLVLKFLNQ